MREPVSCFDHADHSTPEWKLGKRQLDAWHEECRIRELAKAGDPAAKKYLENRSMHYRSRGAEILNPRMARGMA